MKQVLIIGGNGMLGNDIMRTCLEQGWKVDVVYSNNDQFIDERCRKIGFSSLNECGDNYDYVILSSGNFSGSYQDLLTSNADIPLICIRKFVKAKIIFISSINIYGTHHSVITEQSSFNQPNTYGLSKIGGEFIVASHLCYAIIRPSVILGSRMNRNTFIIKLLLSAKYNKKITLFGNGERRQDYVWVSDVSNMVLKAALYPENASLLAVYGESFSNRQIAEYVQLLSNCEIVYSGEDNAPSFEFDSRATNKLLNCNSRTDIFKSIKYIYDSL